MKQNIKLYVNLDKPLQGEEMNQSLKLILSLIFAVILFGQTDTDRKAVEAAVADYVDGIYNVQPDRIDKSVDKNLRKIGYWYDKKKSEWHDDLGMTYEQLYKLAGNWNKDNKSTNPKTAIRKIEILDLLDRTASAKLTAHWGIDYFHLVKKNDKWVIMNVLWQSHPVKDM